MKKNYILFAAILLAAFSIKAQKVILVNGGKYGNNAENVSVVSYDISTKVYNTIDSIGSQSVQDLLIDGNTAFVAAQDSIVKYDLITQTRVAAAKFYGLSTKSLAVYNNYLIVGNFYGKSSHNLYIYDRNNLALIDSIAQITKGASDILVIDSLAYIVQNYTTASYTDSAGYLSIVNLNTLSFHQNVTFNNNGEDLGFLLYRKSDASIVGINSNSVSTFNLNTTATATITLPYNISSNIHNSSLKGDTLFLKINNKIGAVNFNTFNLIDSNIVNYNPIAFVYDTLANQFYTTKSDFFSYSEGKIFSRNGLFTDTLIVASAPELISIYYDNTTSLLSDYKFEQPHFSVYPNPVNSTSGLTQIFIRLEKDPINAQLRLYNVQGQLMNTQLTLKEKELRMDLSHLKKGLYFIQLNDGSESFTQKIILK